MIKFNSNHNEEQYKITQFYISRELENIKKSLDDKNNEIISYLEASVIDALVVGLLAKLFGSNTNTWYIAISLLASALLFLFSYLLNRIKKRINKNNVISGRDKYKIFEDKKKEYIDKFDNVACPSIIICEEYRNKYINCKDDVLKAYYYYEIIYYSSKACRIFCEIYNNKEDYIQDRSTNFIASYRINNFIDLLNNINRFIQQNSSNYTKNKGLKKEIDELNNNVCGFIEIDL